MEEIISSLKPELEKFISVPEKCNILWYFIQQTWDNYKKIFLDYLKLVEWAVSAATPDHHPQ